jgi:hypothetical protein
MPPSVSSPRIDALGSSSSCPSRSDGRTSRLPTPMPGAYECPRCGSPAGGRPSCSAMLTPYDSSHSRSKGRPACYSAMPTSALSRNHKSHETDNHEQRSDSETQFTRHDI